MIEASLQRQANPVDGVPLFSLNCKPLSAPHPPKAPPRDPSRERAAIVNAEPTDSQPLASDCQFWQNKLISAEKKSVEKRKIPVDIYSASG